MAQQTAVEWFAEQVEKILIDLKRNNNPFQLELCLHGINELEEQAKQMEKKQKIGLLNWINEVSKVEPMRLETDHDDIVDQYYNETYGNNQNK